eukprot:Gregarina_sp_Poly_1__3492@NODE_2015_length_2857_cov_67_460932_g1302_i0_p2_GENE_NODE_2015_length_2857_cov_67_460932_g1302_i0NODE_2015_length_2857_cov_67_460932_g1302_i0_p2_ORF_typecomplete_len130_score7_40_NODE_2015_length_2857_cov_67_460932_g1302_i016552044
MHHFPDCSLGGVIESIANAETVPTLQAMLHHFYLVRFLQRGETDEEEDEEGGDWPPRGSRSNRFALRADFPSSYKTESRTRSPSVILGTFGTSSSFNKNNFCNRGFLTRGVTNCPNESLLELFCSTGSS